MELLICNLQAVCFIFKGSTAGKCTVEECIRTIADSINYVIERTEFIVLGKVNECFLILRSFTG